MSYSPGAGSSRLSTTSDVVLTNPANGQTITYNSTTSKWVNSAVSDANAVKLTTAQSIGGVKTFTSDIVAPNVGPSKVTAGTTAPSNPSTGDVWIDTN